MALEFVYRKGRVFAFQLNPADIEVEAQSRVANRIPETQQGAGVGQEGVGMVLDGELQAVGFGAGDAVVLLTPIVLAVVNDVIAFLIEEVKKAAQAESARWINDTVKAMFKKFGPAEKEEKGKPLSLTPEQLAQVRSIVVKKARQLKLSDERAQILADTVVGGLATA